MSKRVITINRMLGSNGRLIGRALADELGFTFYDKELIDIAAQKENIPFPPPYQNNRLSLCRTSDPDPGIQPLRRRDPGEKRYFPVIQEKGKRYRPPVGTAYL